MESRKARAFLDRGRLLIYQRLGAFGEGFQIFYEVPRFARFKLTLGSD